MSFESICKGPHRGLIRGPIFLLLAVSLSGCAVGTIAGAAVSLASGTLTAAADVTSSVVGTVVDVAIPDSDPETTE